MQLQIRKIGDPLGLVVPDALLAALGLRLGDYVRVSEVSPTSLKISILDKPEPGAADEDRMSLDDHPR